MKKEIKSIIYFLALGLFAILPGLALAQDDSTPPPPPAGPSKLMNMLTTVAGEGGYQTDASIASTPKIIGTVIGAFVGFLGITFLILIIIAGYNWMTANGNEESIKKAKSTIKQAIIGLIVAISAYSLWGFIFRRFILLGN